MSTVKHIISLGAGVQSSTMALMAAKGLITPMPDCAIFADVQVETPDVYTWLDWLETQLPFPVLRVTAGNLEKHVLTLHIKKGADGFYVNSGLPAFTLAKDGSKGMTPRQCTTNFKIEPLRKAVRKFAKVPRGCKEVKVIQWIGISLDEAHRMKESRETWQENRWPLVDMRMSRHDCLRWMEANGFPRPPKSACYFCPFKSDAGWRRLKSEYPSLFQRSVMLEKAYQSLKALTKMETTPFLHSKRVPLDQIDFSADDSPELWGNECEGMCGL